MKDKEEDEWEDEGITKKKDGDGEDEEWEDVDS